MHECKVKRAFWRVLSHPKHATGISWMITHSTLFVENPIYGGPEAAADIFFLRPHNEREREREEKIDLAEKIEVRKGLVMNPMPNILHKKFMRHDIMQWPRHYAMAYNP